LRWLAQDCYVSSLCEIVQLLSAALEESPTHVDRIAATNAGIQENSNSQRYGSIGEVPPT